jgi:hypothetical protein
MDQGKVRQSQIEKNRFYQAIFSPGSLAGETSFRSDPVAPTLDKAAEALALLLNRKPPGVV